MQRLTAMFLVSMFMLAPLAGCFGEDEETSVVAKLVPDESMPTTATRGQYLTLNFTSTVDWTVSRSPGLFFMDEFGVLRDDVNFTLPASANGVTMLVLDSERDSIDLAVTAGDQSWNATFSLEAVSYTHLRAHET